MKRALALTAVMASAPSAVADPAEPATTSQTSIAVAVGDSWPINGFQYNLGVGVRVSHPFGRVYTGGMLAIHSGDEGTITYGPVPALGIPGGPQDYHSTPIILGGDLGYEFPIALGATTLSFVPYVSAGLVVTRMASEGSYGDTSITRTDPVVGVGTLVALPLTPTISAGVQWRMYNVGDADFEFGDLDEGTIEHGFGTSIFYSAFYTELVFKI